MRFTDRFCKQERWDKSALTRCAPRSTPLQLPLRHNRPLPTPSRLLPPLTSPLGALGTLAKLTSVTGITSEDLMLECRKRIAQAAFVRTTIFIDRRAFYSSSYNPTDSLIGTFALPN